MRLKALFIIILWMLPCYLLAQSYTIEGKVTVKGGKTPVSGASIFLSNSSFGTTSASDGSFNMNRVRPGQYTLVVTAIGFAQFTKVVMMNSDAVTLQIELEPKAIELRQVNISGSSRADWVRNYDIFKKDFIGNDANAKECVVINPKILNFTWHRKTQVLDADAAEFLVVENRALGYRVKFLLNAFKTDKLEQIVAYEGQRLFEELPGSEAQKKKWQIKRDQAYYGSAMHFYRSLYTNKLDGEGFEMRRLSRMHDPERPPEAVLQKKIAAAVEHGRRDSAQYWYDIANRPKYVNQKLSTVPWYTLEVLRDGPQPGTYAITFPEYLYVIYKKREETESFKDVYRPLDMPNYEVSVVTLFSRPPFAIFDKNGIVIGESPLYEGTWSKARLSRLLPVDYLPSAPL